MFGGRGCAGSAAAPDPAHYRRARPEGQPRRGRGRRSDFVLLHAAVEGAAAEAEGLGRLADVAAEAAERLLDEEALDLFEAHLFEAALAAAARRLEAEVGRR